MHGSSDLIQTLLEHDLVDEFRLWIFPLVLGTGKRLFGDGTIPAGLKLTDSQLSTTGVMVPPTSRPARCPWARSRSTSRPPNERIASSLGPGDGEARPATASIQRSSAGARSSCCRRPSTARAGASRRRTSTATTPTRFWMLEGEFPCWVADGEHLLGPGDFVFAPPGLVHCYRSPGARRCRFLNIHAPGMRFADRLRARLDEFDQHPPPEDGGRPASDGILLAPRRGRADRSRPGARGRVKAGAATGIGSVAVIVFELVRGLARPAAAHPRAG